MLTLKLFQVFNELNTIFEISQDIKKLCTFLLM